jgi:hypothetical protein
MTNHLNTTTGEITDSPLIRPFADWLREQAKGRSHEELGEALHDLIGRVLDTGKKGALTYTVTVERLKDGDALVVKDEIKLKLPEHDRDASLFWADAHGNLVRSNPDQLAFETLREIPGGATRPGNLKDAQ